MLNLTNLFKKKKVPDNLSREDIASILKTTPEALDKFEEAYRTYAIDEPEELNPFDGNMRNQVQENHIVSFNDISEKDLKAVKKLTERIVSELLSQTQTYTWDRATGESYVRESISCNCTVTQSDILSLPAEIRPQLSGCLMLKDIKGDSYESLLYFYARSKVDQDPKMRQTCYHHFRQGLDILDLDIVTYKMIGMNTDSIGYWLPKLVEANRGFEFFKIPSTTVATVPLTLLQLTRKDYADLTQTTFQILDEWAMKAFGLDESKEYFVKTGTHASKYDFRNCRVKGAKEIRELGEYLLFIHQQAILMASPTNTPVIYGVSTTNEWAVREFIPDSEFNPTIYKGLPLHTEYRVFIDCDTDRVLSIVPYWDPDTMKKRFSNAADADSPHKIHDYAIFLAHENTLMDRYQKNRGRVLRHVQEILPYIDLDGQWSLDIMQNGNDFWLIDMARAEHSAFYDSVPKQLRIPSPENWIPELN